MENITELIEQNTINNNILVLPDDILFNLSSEEIDFIIKKFGGKYMFKLPQAEINFFEWLKKNDLEVWSDIWAEDDNDFNNNLQNEVQYLVSINLLSIIVDSDRRGFPICDLIKNDNYYFHIDHMIGEESEIIIDVAKELFTKNKKLTIAQLLALEISIKSIDIWHFAYKYNINLNDAKNAVQELVEDEALVHLTEAEYLLPFLPF